MDNQKHMVGALVCLDISHATFWKQRKQRERIYKIHDLDFNEDWHRIKMTLTTVEVKCFFHQWLPETSYSAGLGLDTIPGNIFTVLRQD